MPVYRRYEKYQKYINGVPLDEYKQGELLGFGDFSSQEDCEQGAIYRWVDSGETVCDGYDLHTQEIKEKSTDNGNTWTRTSETRTGDLIEKWSEACGVVKKYEWRPSGKTRCNNHNEEAEYVYLVSYTMGASWEDVLPRQTEWRVGEAFSDACFMSAEPFTFTFDAGEEGGQLDLSKVVMNSLYSYWIEDGPYGQPYSQDVDKYIMYWRAAVFNKYAIDWGDGGEIEKFDKYKCTSDSVTYWKTSPKPECPFVDTILTYPVKLGTHVYRTGGTKTIKIWGNISLFECNQVKEIIHWGVPIINDYFSINTALLVDLLNDKGVKLECLGDLRIIGFKVEQYTNFNKVVIQNFQGADFGTMYRFQFTYLNYFDMSGSTNMVNPLPYCRFNQGRLQTFYANNCPSLEWTPYLLYLGENNNSSKLINISFLNCPNLKYVRPIEMWWTYNNGGALTQGLDLTSGGTYGKGVFENSLNIEEFNFKYDVYVGSIDFKPYTKLKKITGNLISDSMVWLGSEGQFYQFCKGHQTLEDISELTLDGAGFEGAFMDCPKIKTPCTTIIHGTNSTGYTYLSRMYSNTGIETLDISKIYLGGNSENMTFFTSMFSNCKELTTITGELLDNQIISSSFSFLRMFEGCSKLTTISSIFKNKTYLPSLDIMFKDCDIRSIPNDIFNASYEGTDVNIPTYMFLNNVNLTNYPIFNGLPMWKMPPFFFEEITQAKTFLGCPLIAKDVPYQWGGYKDSVPFIIKVTTTTEDEIVKYPFNWDKKLEVMDRIVIFLSDIGKRISNSQWQFPSPGTYTLNIYHFDKEYIVRIPVLTVEIIDWGNAYDIASYLPNTIRDSNVTKLPYGKKLFYKYTNFMTSLAFGDIKWFLDNKITDVADNLLLNCGNVTSINGEYGGFCMNLSADKYTKMFSYLTNLTKINYLFRGDLLGLTQINIDSTCGIFKNNPALTDIKHVFHRYEGLTSIAVDEFSNNPELQTVYYAFKDCVNLTNMPNFRENKKITDFRYAFSGCTNLKGSTPTDENGYKLWERAGKEGYPSTIDGQHCFEGCTQLDDYDQIPDYWK